MNKQINKHLALYTAALLYALVLLYSLLWALWSTSLQERQVAGTADGVPKGQQSSATLAVSTPEELQAALVNGDCGEIVLASDITLDAPLTVNGSGAVLRLRSLGDTAVLRAPSGRHLNVAGSDLSLALDGVVLDGCGTGGGIYSTASGLSLSGAVIQNCVSASNGGGVEAAGGSLLLLDGTCLQNNKAAGHGGGVFGAAGVSIHIEGAQLQGNAAEKQGGGVFCGAGGSVRIQSGEISGNGAVLGGGIYAEAGGTLRLHGGTLHGNTAEGTSGSPGNGGGVYLVGGTLEAHGTLIRENQAHSGGGVYATGDGCVVIIRGSTLHGNQAVGADGCGGGIYLDTAHSSPNNITLDKGTLKGNSAVRGGGVYLAGGSSGTIPGRFTANGGQICENTAGHGGGILAEQGGWVVLLGGTLRDNSASHGGAVWIAPLENISAELGVVFSGNRADTGVHTPREEHIQLHGEKIKGTAFSHTFQYAYNNYDICYSGDTPERSFTIHLDYGGGSGGPTSLGVLYGRPVGEFPQPRRQNYIFVGWYDSQGNRYCPATIYGAQEDITLTARWIGEEGSFFTVIFQHGEAESGGEEVRRTVPSGETVGELPAPVQEGYTLEGWYTRPNGQGIRCTPATPIGGNTTLYANWIPGKNTVTFFYNGGEKGGKESSRQVDYGAAVGTLPTPGRTGHHFAGWFTQPQGGDKVSAGTLVQENTTFYARWEPLTYSLHFQYEGSTGGETTPGREVTFGSSIGPLPQPQGPAGQIFLGWFDEEGSPYYPSTIYRTDRNLKLYARFAAGEESHSITFHYGGSEGEEPGRNVENGSALGELPLPSREGYRFGGWWNPGYTTRYSGQEQVTADLELHALWTDDSWSVRFDYGSATGDTGEAERSISHGTSLGALPKPTRTGYTFAGWVDQTGNPVYSTTTVTGNLLLTAQWEPEQHQLLFHYQGGGQGLPQSRQVRYGQQIGMLPLPERKGYRFAGWYGGPEGSGAYYDRGTSSAIFLQQEDLPLYALWEPVRYTITFDYQGAQGGNDVAQKQVTFGGNAGSLPLPQREGYHFAGWHTGPQGTGSALYPGTGYTLRQDVTLYAQWQQPGVKQVDTTQNPTGTPSSGREAALGQREERIDALDAAQGGESVLDEAHSPINQNPITSDPREPVEGWIITALAALVLALVLGTREGKRH